MLREKVSIPNQITIEGICSPAVEQVLKDYSEVEGRIIVQQESLRNIGRDEGKVTITIPDLSFPYTSLVG